MWKAFEELRTLGLVCAGRPRMISVQAEGGAPIVRAFERGARFAEPRESATSRASGIRVPSAVGDLFILDAIGESGGAGVAVDGGSISKMQLLAGRMGAGYVGPESAAALAAVPELLSKGLAGRDEEIVVFGCGAGHKCPPFPDAPVVDPDGYDLDGLLESLGTRR